MRRLSFSAKLSRNNLYPYVLRNILEMLQCCTHLVSNESYIELQRKQIINIWKFHALAYSFIYLYVKKCLFRFKYRYRIEDHFKTAFLF